MTKTGLEKVGIYKEKITDPFRRIVADYYEQFCEAGKRAGYINSKNFVGQKVTYYDWKLLTAPFAENLTAYRNLQAEMNMRSEEVKWLRIKLINIDVRQFVRGTGDLSDEQLLKLRKLLNPYLENDCREEEFDMEMENYKKSRPKPNIRQP